MLRWIDTHNHLFVLPEEQQKKEVSVAPAPKYEVSLSIKRLAIGFYHPVL